MRVWIVNYYTGTPESVSNPRYIQLASHFKKAGHDVITLNASHNNNFKGVFDEKKYGEYQFVHVKVPQYKESKLKRMFSMWLFAWRIYRHCEQLARPDIILHNIHPPFDYPVVWAANKIKCKYVTEAWDVWPDVYVHKGLASARNPIVMLGYWAEKHLYYRANELIFTFKGCHDYMKIHKLAQGYGGKVDLNHVHYNNNGVDIEQFDKDVKSYPRPDKDINESGIYKIIYMGSIRQPNGVKSLIDAAKLLRDNPKYRFFIYGDGTDREMLEKYVDDNQIINVVFKEKRIPLCEVAWVVSQATVNIMNYAKGFGYMGVSSGKLFQYLAAGKPIVCNIDIAYDDVITDNKIGIAKDIDTPEEYVNAIKQLAEQSPEDYETMCQRARKVGEQFDYQIIAAREMKILNL